MAEGPQVHRIADSLRRALASRVLDEVQLTPARLRHLEGSLVGRRVCYVEAHGKHLLIALDRGLTLHSHLMMWGRWEISGPSDPPRKGTGRLWARLRAGSRVATLFNGPVLELLSQDELAAHPVLTALGPDPLRDDYRREDVLHRIQQPPWAQASLAHALLDQRLFAGVGNIYKSEVLWQARLHPLRTLDSLDPEERDRLLQVVESTLRTAYRQRFGTLPRRLWRTVGPFAVYGRSGQPCLWCGTTLLRLDTGRATYFCPSCQPAKGSLRPRE
ncbi:MAG: DNA-formamidopyrimidine glycosylase family protein [Armatimonadota bacterium]|nr:DNA-formamidopyrimidine glycosylase family protein [Armatimonadota bacterium]MDR7413650.1 DNA-formamidopyrimidine glycosylase family protein [Armatimonadota bacterium]MDR7428891.1 DNA-formamidopyrimidine glycosylase family protein [Armatimonadota bacterium]MDR7431480.1 DNA-formamidopyrimidine glycosylase family protein [Armatimonadota bacterium]MDR7476090.1 DNA-formamidopyrimidine glycosylase family protein [Armatimonadota bacterium]